MHCLEVTPFVRKSFHLRGEVFLEASVLIGNWPLSAVVEVVVCKGLQR